MTEHGRTLESLSEAQASAWRQETLPSAEEVMPGIWAVGLPIPGGHLPSSFGYVTFDDTGVDIIDAGWDGDETLDTWQTFLKQHGKSLEDVRTVTATHHHPDHLGLAGKLREISRATVRLTRIEHTALQRRVDEAHTRDEYLVPQLEHWGVPKPVIDTLMSALSGEDNPVAIEPDELLEAGHTFEFGNLNLTTIITPGHTAGHACFVDERAGVIFTGDHVLPGIAPGIALGRVGDEDPLLDYVEALHRMTAYDACEVLPGHEYRFTGLAERARQIAAHHLRRTRALQKLQDELGDASVWAYAERAPWSRGWHRLDGFLLYSALTQTEQHLFSLRAGRIQPWLDSTWPG